MNYLTAGDLALIENRRGYYGHDGYGYPCHNRNGMAVQTKKSKIKILKEKYHE